MTPPAPAPRLQPGARMAVVHWSAAALVMAGAVLASGCGRERRAAPQSLPLAVAPGADTGVMTRLEIRPPLKARAWLARVSPERPVPPAVTLPAAEPDTVSAELVAPPALEIEPGLLPPVLREAAPLRLPPGGRPQRFESVELDVRVDEHGVVTDVIADQGADPRLVEAASACAKAMRFYPARRGGEPVAVWCRQRFDFGPGAAVRP